MARTRPPREPTKRRVQLDLPPRMHDKLRLLAEHDGKSMNKFILMLLAVGIPAYELDAGKPLDE